MNGAKCISLTIDDGSYKCQCREGTYGKNCEHSERTTTTIKPVTSTSSKPTSPVQSHSKPTTLSEKPAKPTKQPSIKPTKPTKPIKPENVTLVYAQESPVVVEKDEHKNNSTKTESDNET